MARIGEQGLEAALQAGRVSCPDCAGSLRPWGFAREREVRTRHGGRLLRPRRGYCRGCERSHVLLPAFCVPRRRDSAQVIGLALLASARGEGHRTIAARLDRPPGTVRGWVRAFARRSDALQCCAVRWAVALGDPPGSRPSGAPVTDTLETLAWAARAWVLRCGPNSASVWELIVALCGGGLLHGRPRDPRRY